jgi:hypothetical protein
LVRKDFAGEDAGSIGTWLQVELLQSTLCRFIPMSGAAF